MGLPAGIAEVVATVDGFRIVFAQPINTTLASRPTAYAISSYRRLATPAYGGPDQDRRDEIVRQVAVAPDGRRVDLILDKTRLRAGFVYEFHLRNLVGEGEIFHPADAYYTLRDLVR